VCKEICVKLTGENIKRLCEERGLGVKDLQKALGLESRQAIYKWWEGKNIPSIDNLIKLSNILGVTVEDIIVFYEEDNINV